MTSSLAIALALCLAADAPQIPMGVRPTRRVALVLGEGAAPTPAQLDAIRAQLAREFSVLDDPLARHVLEGFERSRSVVEQVREHLSRARQALRRFEMAEVTKELSIGEHLAAGLPFDKEGRDVAVELAVREAEVALVNHDEREQAQDMERALSIQPDLHLDPSQFAPTLVRLLEQARARIARAPSRVVVVETAPPGAHVYVDQRDQGTTPLTMTVHATAAVLWVVKDGFGARAAWVDFGAAPKLRFELEPLSLEARVAPLVDAMRHVRDERSAVAMALADLLHVDGVALVEGSSPVPTLFMRPPPTDAAPRALGAALVAPAPSLTRSAHPRSRVLMWGSFASAGLAAGIGATFAILTEHADHQLDALPTDAQGHLYGMTERDAASLALRSRQDATVANVSLIAAGALAATGLVLWLVGHRADASAVERPEASP